MYRVGVDFGGTRINAIVYDDELNRIVGKHEMNIRVAQSKDFIIEDLKKAIDYAIQSSRLDMSQIASIGLGAPGTVNTNEGIVEHASNFDLDNAPIKQIIEEQFHIPTFVENDANCMALGEAVAGAGHGVDNFMAITLGTGVGAGIVLNGKLLHGCNDASSELGHMVIKFGGERCKCGRRGCWEAYASEDALIQQTKDSMANNFDTVMWDICGGDIRRVDERTAFEALRERDALAQQVVNNYIYYVSVGIVNAINIFQPDRLCIGGGVTMEGDTLLSRINYYVNNEHYSIHSQKQTIICAATLGNDACAIGAALLNQQHD